MNNITKIREGWENIKRESSFIEKLFNKLFSQGRNEIKEVELLDKSLAYKGSLISLYDELINILIDQIAEKNDLDDIDTKNSEIILKDVEYKLREIDYKIYILSNEIYKKDRRRNILLYFLSLAITIIVSLIFFLLSSTKTNEEKTSTTEHRQNYLDSLHIIKQDSTDVFDTDSTRMKNE